VEKTIRGCFQETEVPYDTCCSVRRGDTSFLLLLYITFLYIIKHLQSSELIVPYRVDGSNLPILQCSKWLRDS